MSTGPDEGERARLFVALELPDPARETLLRWRSEAIAPGAGIRLIGREDLHATLCFLGWRPASEIEAIVDACRMVAAERPASLALGPATWLPPRRPRVLAVELEDAGGALAVVQERLSRTLQAGGWYVPESRPYLPHVTVARAGKSRRAPLPAPPPMSFEASRVTVYRSRLSAAGARYEPLATVELGTGRAPSDPLAVVSRFHAEQARAYAEGAVDVLEELLSDDVVWHVPGRSRIAGEHRGRRAVLDYLELRRRMTDATFRVRVRGMALIDGRVVQLAGGEAQRGGRALSWETVGVFRVAHGQIAECWLVPFDQYEFDEIWS